MKVIEIAATRWHILKLKCTKFDFGWGSGPDLAGGAYSAPSDLPAGFQGPTSKRKGGKRRGYRREDVGERMREERERKKRKGE